MLPALAKVTVPPYSQFIHVKDPLLKDRSCGIVALKSIMDFLGAKTPQMDELIRIGLRRNAFRQGYGWTHQGLVSIAKDFGLGAAPYNLSSHAPDKAFTSLKRVVCHTPCIALIHKGLDLKNDEQLVVITEITDGIVFYNDPAAATDELVLRQAPVELFLQAWKRQVIIVKQY